MSPRLTVDFRTRVGGLDLEVRLDEEVAFTALFGPSGAGKTTLLDVLAGLRRAVRGRVRFGDVTYLDTDRGVFVPPHHRRLGYVFQDARLFPHVSVEANLRYGRPPRGRRFRFDEAVEVLGIGSLLARRPGSLSGGERQRVALGRALLSEPDLLLMDEPLGALDLPARVRLLVHLKSVHETFSLPILYVSHDLTSVINFTGRMIYLEAGRVKAIGSPFEALARATGRQVEGLVENAFEGRVAGRDAAAGTLHVEAGPVTFVTRDHGEPIGAPVVVTVPASEVILVEERPGKVSTRNVFAGRVQRVESLGPRRLVLIDVGPGLDLSVEVVPETVEDLALAPGRPLHVLIKAASVSVLR